MLAGGMQPMTLHGRAGSFNYTYEADTSYVLIGPMYALDMFCRPRAAGHRRMTVREVIRGRDPDSVSAMTYADERGTLYRYAASPGNAPVVFGDMWIRSTNVCPTDTATA
jgi:hypothetical protein